MKIITPEILFKLIRSGLGIFDEIITLEIVDWDEVFSLAFIQNVYAIAFDG